MYLYCPVFYGPLLLRLVAPANQSVGTRVEGHVFWGAGLAILEKVQLAGGPWYLKSMEVGSVVSVQPGAGPTELRRCVGSR